MPYPNSAHNVFTVINMLTGPYNERLGSRCWPFTGGLNAKGRPYYRVGGKSYLAYRLAYELVYGEGTLENKMAMHQCDNQVCCNPSHIKPGNQELNMKEMRDRERTGLPHHTVRAIRKLGESGAMTHQAIGELYGIARSTVSEILSGLKYRDVKEEGSEESSST